MPTKRKAIQDSFIAHLGDVDAQLSAKGFLRRKTALVYSRQIHDAVQKIDLHIELSPLGDRQAIAAVYPWLEVRIASVENAVASIGATGPNRSLVPYTLRQPIEFTSAKAASGRWYIREAGDFARCADDLSAFLNHWTVPFLDQYATAHDICSAHDSADERVLNDDLQALRAIAALTLCGHRADAVQLAERRFGRPGPRPHYREVFDFLTKSSDPRL